MSYIDEVLKGIKPSSNEIENHLFREGFKYEHRQERKEIMTYQAENRSKVVRISLHKEHLNLHVEHYEGRRIHTSNYPFEQDNYNSFISAYHNSIDCAKDYLEV